MANQEQLEILKKGSMTWNLWRTDHPNAKVDLTLAELREADLSRVDLSGANLSKADLSSASLREAFLSKANLSGANLREAFLRGANLSGADLSDADLSDANLSEADLSDANLSGAGLIKADLSLANLSAANLNGAHPIGANLSAANLSAANLSGANLSGANFNEANLIQTDFKQSRMELTLLVRNDLSSTLGLETIFHHGPSTIDRDTIRKSKGHLPVAFLRGCGLSDWEIEAAKLHDPKLSNETRNDIVYKIYDLQVAQAIQISPLFISYSHADTSFVDELEKLLNNKGIRFWRDIHDATAGRLERQIDRAIRQNPTVLLVLSKNSIKSDWVEHEVNLARKLEKDTEHDVLCPVALDDSWKNSSWSQVLMEQVMKYYILDCSCWEDNDELKRIFVKLVDGLNLYYRKDN